MWYLGVKGGIWFNVDSYYPYKLNALFSLYWEFNVYPDGYIGSIYFHKYTGHLISSQLIDFKLLDDWMK